MSDTPVEIPSVSVTVGANAYNFIEVNEPLRATSKNKNPGSVVYVKPVLGSAALIGAFVTDWFDSAGDKADALFDKLFVPFFKNMADNGLYSNEGEVYAEKIPTLLVTLRHKSGALTEEQLTKIGEELNIESLELLKLDRLQREDKPAFLASLAAAGSSEDDFAVRYLNLINRMEDHAAARAKLAAAKAERAAKRAENAKKAAAATPTA